MAGQFNANEFIGAFAYFDRESTGSLDVTELRYILSGLGQPLAPQDVEAYIAEADPHNSGWVDYTAFVNMVAGALAQVS